MQHVMMLSIKIIHHTFVLVQVVSMVNIVNSMIVDVMIIVQHHRSVNQHIVEI